MRPIGKMGVMSSTVKTVPAKQDAKTSPESILHKLKLQWMMAKDDAEKKRLSEEIRRQMASAKKP